MTAERSATGRCWGDGDPLMAAYHDDEWGRPVRDERGLFEKVCLEGFQAGLSWRTVLVRREALRAAFAGFDPDALAGWDDADVARALAADGVLRNAAKCRAVVTNARATVALRDAADVDGGLAGLVWSHAPGPRPAPRSLADVPATTPESEALARALRRRGFSFVGATTCYALMQADGLVDDHLATCPVRDDVERERAAALR